MPNSVKNYLFQNAFSRIFVYNILFEDAEVDEQFLGLNSNSKVLSITGAGCGVAGMLSSNPKRIDAVDINHHHLAIACLKMTSAQYLSSYSTFYDLCGRGWQADPEATIRQISQYMPRKIQRYWNKNHRRFERSIYLEGMTSKMVKLLRNRAGVDSTWLRWLADLDRASKLQAIEEKIEPALRMPFTKNLLDSPFQLIALGVNYEQKARLLKNESDLVEFFIKHIKKVAETDLHTNWFAWHALAGGFNHDNPDAIPPYLRQDRFNRSRKAKTTVKYHNSNIFDVLKKGVKKQWSHYTLCDAPDWMNTEQQVTLLNEILRTAEPGATLLVRTVEDDCIVDRLGYTGQIKRQVGISEKATLMDRSKQYRHVHFYEVQG